MSAGHEGESQVWGLISTLVGGPAVWGAIGYGADRLLDVQWTTDHLASLGAVDVSRARYLELLRAALGLPLPARWA